MITVNNGDLLFMWSASKSSTRLHYNCAQAPQASLAMIAATDRARFDSPKPQLVQPIFPAFFAVWIAGAAAGGAKIPSFLPHRRGTKEAVSN
jgi:hypothetical protein